MSKLSANNKSWQDIWKRFHCRREESPGNGGGIVLDRGRRWALVVTGQDSDTIVYISHPNRTVTRWGERQVTAQSSIRLSFRLQSTLICARRGQPYTYSKREGNPPQILLTLIRIEAQPLSPHLLSRQSILVSSRVEGEVTTGWCPATRRQLLHWIPQGQIRTVLSSV